MRVLRTRIFIRKWIEIRIQNMWLHIERPIPSNAALKSYSFPASASAAAPNEGKERKNVEKQSRLSLNREGRAVQGGRKKYKRRRITYA